MTSGPLCDLQSPHTVIRFPLQVQIFICESRKVIQLRKQWEFSCVFASMQKGLDANIFGGRRWAVGLFLQIFLHGCIKKKPDLATEGGEVNCFKSLPVVNEPPKLSDFQSLGVLRFLMSLHSVGTVRPFHPQPTGSNWEAGFPSRPTSSGTGRRCFWNVLTQWSGSNLSQRLNSLCHLWKTRKGDRRRRQTSPNSSSSRCPSSSDINMTFCPLTTSGSHV